MKKEFQKKISTNSKGNISFSLEIDDVINQLKKRTYILKKDMEALLICALEIFKNQPNMIMIESPISVVGDIHGQFYDMLNIFQKFGYPDKNSYLFLGDYVDRGAFGMEVLTLLLVYKLKYPKKVHLLRGNHESRILTTSFNFRQECLVKYGSNFYEIIMQLFDALPIAAVIDEVYFAVHAGLSPQLTYLNDIQKINRFVQIPEKGILCDLLWSDPIDEDNHLWHQNVMRSCSFYYSPIQSAKFMNNNKLKMILRGHEVQMAGYKYQMMQNKNTKQALSLTIFSAPNYCDNYKNKGAIAEIKKDELKIKTFKHVEHPFTLSNFTNILQWSLPFVAVNVGKILEALVKNRGKSRHSSINQKKLGQLNFKEKIEAENKLSFINSLLQLKVNQNHTIILQSQRQQKEEKVEEDIQKAFLLFCLKKKTDKNQMRPALVFGPKIQMHSLKKAYIDELQPSDINDN